MKAKLIKDHVYDNVYGYNSHEIWICSEVNSHQKSENLFFYYIDGNTAVTKKQLLPWYPRFKTIEEAINHGQKRIDNIQLETKLLNQ